MSYASFSDTYLKSNSSMVTFIVAGAIVTELLFSKGTDALWSAARIMRTRCAFSSTAVWLASSSSASKCTTSAISRALSTASSEPSSLAPSSSSLAARGEAE